MTAPRLARSAGVIGLATMSSRLLGLVREQVLAYYFGASDAMDAFRVAVRVPNLLRDLFAEGAMSSALVPTFTATLTHDGRPRAWQLAHSVFTALTLITGALVLAGIVFAPALIRFMAGDFADVPGKFELTVQLSRIALPFLTLVALAAACMGMLNALGTFFIPALSPAMFNVASILLVVALVPFTEALGLQPIVIVAVGMLAGGAGQVALQWPALRRAGYRYRPMLDLHDPALRRVLLLMGPGTMGLAATQLNVFINTILATGEGTGAVSYLDYAFRLMYLPIGVFGISVATATTPAVSKLIATGERHRVGETITHAVGLTALLNIPATLGLIVLAEPIIQLIYEHGSFTASDTLATAAALRFYALGLMGYAVARIIAPTFYAMGMSRTPVIISMLSVAVSVALNLLLVQSLSYRGLALGTSLAALFNASAQVWMLRRALGTLETRAVIDTILRVLLASAAMSVAAWGSHGLLLRMLPGDTVLLQAVRLGAAMATGVAALALAAWALRVAALREVAQLVARRIGGTRRG